MHFYPGYYLLQQTPSFERGALDLISPPYHQGKIIFTVIQSLTNILQKVFAGTLTHYWKLFGHD